MFLNCQVVVVMSLEEEDRGPLSIEVFPILPVNLSGESLLFEEMHHSTVGYYETKELGSILS
jgi:hypothetical protein